MRCPLSFGPGLGFLPVIQVVLTFTTFGTTYVISVAKGDVLPTFPYISDTGTKVPESTIFGQFLNISAFLALCNMYIRYRLVHEFVQDSSSKIRRLNIVGLVMGVLVALGMSLVANFQETNVKAVHFVGAAFAFGIGVLYCFLQCLTTYFMYPAYNGYSVFLVRLLMATLSLIFCSSTTIFGFIAQSQWAHSQNGQMNFDKLKWEPGDPGYAAHLVSTSSEWATAFAFMFFFYTFLRDFQKISLTIQAQLHVTHLDQPPPCRSYSSVNSSYQSAAHRPPSESSRLLL